MTIQKICDIYLSKDERNFPHPHRYHLRKYPILERYTEGFSAGFMGLDMPRLDGILFVMELRKANISCMNVPIEYRDQPKLSIEEALQICRERFNPSAYILDFYRRSTHPMLWTLGRAPYPEESGNAPEEGGGLISVDKLDGHIWTNEEQIVYAYDYNNRL